MFPQFDADRRPRAASPGHGRVARARPSARSSSTARRAAERRGRGDDGHPGAPGDQPGRPARHDRRPRHPDQPRRQDLARRRGGARHGQDLRRAAPRRSTSTSRPRFAAVDGTVVSEGDVISIDGSTGEVFRRRGAGAPLARSMLYFDGLDAGLGGRRPEASALVAAVDRMLRARRRASPAARCAPTPTPPRTPRAPAASAPRASACAAPSTCSSASAGSSIERADPRRHRRGARRRAGGAAAAAARRTSPSCFEAMDGLPVDDPPDRPAAARVPARPRPSCRSRSRWPRRAASPTRHDVALLAAVAADARAEPDARPARRPARPGRAGAVRAAGAGDRRGHRRSCAGAGTDPQPEIMVPLVGSRAGAAAGPRGGARRSWRRSPRRPASSCDIPIGTHDRAAARRADRAPDRRGGRLLLLRHQRPHADDVGLLPRRRRGRVLRRLPGERHLRRLPVRDARRATASGRLVRSPATRAAGRRSPTCSSASAASTAATPSRSTSSTTSGLDYVSCSPFRVPVARLEAGRATVVTKSAE